MMILEFHVGVLILCFVGWAIILLFLELPSFTAWFWCSVLLSLGTFILIELTLWGIYFVSAGTP